MKDFIYRKEKEMKLFKVEAIIYATIEVETEDEESARSMAEDIIYDRHPDVTDVDINNIEEE